MNLKFLLALLVLFLPACGTLSTNVGSGVSDLDALEANVKRELAPRQLPNGEIYCGELAETERRQDDCIGDLEDTLFLSEKDKVRALDLLTTGLERIRLRLVPCKWWDYKCHQRLKDLP